MTDPFAPFIERRGAAVLDGGLATELESRGLALDDPLWSARALIDAPAIVAAVHRDYLEAGADVIATATYQATIRGWPREASRERGRRVLLSGVARPPGARCVLGASGRTAATAPGRLVAASIGSYGAFLADGSEYRGDYGLDVDALAAWHRPRLRHPRRERSRISWRSRRSRRSSRPKPSSACSTRRDGPPAWISFQARTPKHLADGARSQAAARARRALLARRRRRRQLRRAGAGRAAARAVRLGDGQAPRRVPESRGRVGRARRGAGSQAAPTPAFDELARGWRAAGGPPHRGCCRTTPADIRAIASRWTRTKGTLPFSPNGSGTAEKGVP